MIGKTLGGATVATIQGLLVLVICLIAGFRPVNWAILPFALVFMILTAIVFSGLGIAIGSMLQDMQGFQLIMNFLVMPIFFLSGALFPLNNLPSVLSFVTRIDPLSYGIDGLRNVLIGASQFEPMISLAVLGGVAVLFLALGSYSFSKIQL
jgi:ABC-2 type transport system permease protein